MLPGYAEPVMRRCARLERGAPPPRPRETRPGGASRGPGSDAITAGRGAIELPVMPTPDTETARHVPFRVGDVRLDPQPSGSNV